MSYFRFFSGTIVRGDLGAVRQEWRAEYMDERYVNGWSSLHWASRFDASGDIVRFFLEEGVDIEGVSDDGCRPIHYAALEGLTRSLRVLVDAGCSLEAVANRGATPLDHAVRLGKHDCSEILLAAMSDDALVKNNYPWKVVDHQSRETLLDRSKKSPRMMAALRAKPVSKKEVKEWISSMPGQNYSQSLLLVEECLLYRCIRHGSQSGFVTLCSPEIVNRETLFMGPSALETAVEFDGVLFVAHILKRFVTVDESWTRAAALAKKNELTNISLILSKRISYLRDLEERGYSRLHIAVYDNDPDMVRYILDNKLCDPDEGNKTVGTAIGLAYSQGHMNCVRCLQNNDVNLNTIDRVPKSSTAVAGAANTAICTMCCDEKINCALTCGHMFCMTCADKVAYCYVCRRLITDKRRIRI